MTLLQSGTSIFLPLRRFALVLLLMTMFAGAAQAQFTVAPDPNGNGLDITGYSGPGGAVTIPSTYLYYSSTPVIGIANGAFSGNTAITSVTFPNSITLIADSTTSTDGAFQGCTNLTSVTFGTGLTSIGRSAFNGCTSLTGIIIPDSVGGIGLSAFLGCTDLVTVSIGQGVAFIEDLAFTGSSKLTSITVAAGNTSFTAVGNVLFNSAQTTLIQYPTGSAATSYTIPSGVTLIGDDAFASSVNLTTVTIPSSVATIGISAFSFSPLLASAVFQGNAPSLYGSAFIHTAANFTVTYNYGATGFTTPTWAPDANDSYASIALGAPDVFGGVVKPSGYKKSAWFGTYSYGSYPLVYQFNLGYEYAFDANNGGGVYLYDYVSDHFWYTQPSYFPYLYDFTLNTFLYYYQAKTPHRHFYNVNTNQVITE